MMTDDEIERLIEEELQLLGENDLDEIEDDNEENNDRTSFDAEVRTISFENAWKTFLLWNYILHNRLTSHLGEE